MTRFAVVVLALLLGACAPSPHANVLSGVAQSVLLLKNSQGGYGSGIVIECRPAIGGGFRVFILTEAHVLTGGMVTIDEIDKVELAARHPDTAVDSALLDGHSDHWLPSVSLEPAEPALGDTLYILGYGMENLWISSGIACGHGRSSTPVCPGDSGGAIVTDAGRLVGTVDSLDVLAAPWSGQPEGVWHHCMYTPVHDLLPWLRAYIRVR